MLLLTGSMVLAGLTLLSMWLLSAHDTRARGWHVVMATQCLWVPYDIYSKQYGFLILTPVTIAIAVRALRKG